MWTTNLKGVHVALNADGTYGKGYSPESAMGSETQDPELAWGTWTIEEGILTFTTSDETRYYSGVIGTYEVVMSDSGDQVDVTLVEDACDKREEDFPSGLTRETDT